MITVTPIQIRMISHYYDHDLLMIILFKYSAENILFTNHLNGARTLPLGLLALPPGAPVPGLVVGESADFAIFFSM